MMPRQRNRYNETFKRKVVLHYIGHECTLSDSAMRFGITASMLSKWVARYAPDKNEASTPILDYALEIKRLQDEISEIKNVLNRAIVQKNSNNEIEERFYSGLEKKSEINEFCSTK